jgi:hypothetical protein
VLITSTIDTFEGRDVTIVAVPGGFLTIRGRLTELMVQTAPAMYCKYITVGSDNKPILNLKLQKALYGCPRRALLFYLKLVEDL